MNKAILIVLLAIVFVSGCTQTTETTEEGTTITTQENLVTEKMTFEDEDVEGSITKNKLTKTAQIDMTMYVNDSTEEESSFGDTSLMPWALNMTCHLFAEVFFNADAWEEANMTSETEMSLEGYDVTRFEFDVLDRETNEKISRCTGISKETLVQ